MSQISYYSLAESARYLCHEATKSEGMNLATRLLVESLTPGLRHFNAFFKESLREALHLRAPELERKLKEYDEFEELLGTICRDLKQAQSQEWWLRIIEVAECGAQRDVLTRLIYKQIVSSDEAQAYRGQWQALNISAGGAQQLIRTLGKNKNDAEKLIIEQVSHSALSLRMLPKLSAEAKTEWLIKQSKLIEHMMGQNWGEARQVLKELVKLAPRDPAVSLYWSLLKCSEGKVEEALNGIKRAAEVCPQDQELIQLAQESQLWRQSLLDDRLQRANAEKEINKPQKNSKENHAQADLVSSPMTAPTNLAGYSLAQSHQNDWRLPSGLLQAIADLGPERTLDLSITGLMSQLYHLNIEQKSQLNSALQRYPEASGLKLVERQIARSLALIERGLGVYHVDPKQELSPLTFGGSQMATLSPVQLAELRQMGKNERVQDYEFNPLETPPPIPFDQDEVAPTALVNLVKEPLKTGGLQAESLSVDIDQPLDFTLEPEITDLARAEELMRRGEFAQAEHCLLNLLDQNPFDACVHNDLGVLYFQTQRFGDAKAHFMLAIECNPQYEEAWSNLVELFASLGHLHHALPFFRRFETLVETSVSLRRLRELCAQFAPADLDQLQPPQYADTVGLKLPLSGSFFIAPSEDDEFVEAISAPLPLEWDPEEQAKVLEAREKAQQEMAVQKRAEVNQLLDQYQAQSRPNVPKAKTGLFAWIKTQIGLEKELEPTPPEAHLSPEQELEQNFDPQAPPALAPKPLPEDIHRVRNIAFSMLCVPAGSFKMGTHINSPYGAENETPQHTVVMSRAFQLARVPVTQELYQAVMFRNPSHIKAPGHPVVRVSWFDAIRFCNALSELEGLPPVYVIDSGARPEVAIKPDCAGYRLPTEAEWEYCARARQNYKFAGSDEAHRVAWAQVDKLQTVARKESNSWGFYDLSGNVWEWCNDALREYNAESQLDPQGEAHAYMHTPSARVIRGGSWCFEEDGARVAFRGRGAPGLRITSLGFRIARSL